MFGLVRKKKCLPTEREQMLDQHEKILRQQQVRLANLEKRVEVQTRSWQKPS